MKKLFILTVLILFNYTQAYAGYGIGWKCATNTGIDGVSSGVAANGSGYNNVNAPAGTQVAFIQQIGSIEQSFNVSEAGKYTVSFQASMRWWPEAKHDFNIFVDNNKIAYLTSTQVPAHAFRSFKYDVDLTAGSHIIKFVGVNTAGGDHTSFIDDVKIVGVNGNIVSLKNASFEDIKLIGPTYLANPPEFSVPFFRFDGRITTSGECIYGQLLNISNNAYIHLQSLSVMPTIKINDVPVGTARQLINTGVHRGFLLFLPQGVRAVTGDTVTLSAPQEWAKVKNDFCEAMNDQDIKVFTDRSYTGSDDVERKLGIGLNIGHLQTPFWGTYKLIKNLRVSILNWASGGVLSADSNWFPTKLSKDTVIANFIGDANFNGLDNTGTPTPEGLYAIGWGRTSPSTVDCSIISQDADVVERKDLANPGDENGRGFVRVFNVKRKTNATRVNFSLDMSLTDKTREPKLTYLVIYGPGDFKYQDNTPTVLEDVDNPSALSSMAKQRLSSGLKISRFGDGQIGFDNATNLVEPEDLMFQERFSWAGWIKSPRIQYTQARPWVKEQSPYIYSSLIGEKYNATLGQAIAASTPGSIETIQVTDAVTAPVFDGLILQAGDERMTVLSVTGTDVKVRRGSESTLAVAHDAGPISVSGRLAVNSPADFTSQYGQVFELVTKDLHHVSTGMHLQFNGTGWPSWLYTDNSQPSGGSLRYYKIMCFVTGPNTIAFCWNGGASTKTNVTLKEPVTLDPVNAYSDNTVPPSDGFPYSVTASVANQLNSDLHVNFSFCASDTLVDHIARILLNSCSPGRRIYIEYANEPWNWAYITAHSQSNINWLINKSPQGQMIWQVRRTGQIHKRVAKIFAEKGRQNEVRSVLNTQFVTAGGNVDSIVRQAVSENLPPPDIAVAPYTQFGNQESIIKGINAANIAQGVDIWIYHNTYGLNGSNGPVPYMDAQRKAVDSINTQLGTSVELFGYEGGVEQAWPQINSLLTADVLPTDNVLHLNFSKLYDPGMFLRVGNEWVKVTDITGLDVTVERAQNNTVAGTYKAGTGVRNSWIEAERDLIYHPNFRIAEFDQYAVWQKYFNRINANGYSYHHVNGYQEWGMYHAIGQLPGRGDGRDGKFDNRTLLALPGFPNTKQSSQNQDDKVVSVRGQALIEWNRAVRKK